MAAAAVKEGARADLPELVAMLLDAAAGWLTGGDSHAVTVELDVRKA